MIHNYYTSFIKSFENVSAIILVSGDDDSGILLYYELKINLHKVLEGERAVSLDHYQYTVEGYLTLQFFVQ